MTMPRSNASSAPVAPNLCVRLSHMEGKFVTTKECTQGNHRQIGILRESFTGQAEDEQNPARFTKILRSEGGRGTLCAAIYGEF
jgi:hypothetical protein